MGISVCRTSPFKIHSTKTHSCSHNLWTEWLQKHYRSPVLSPPCTTFNLFSTQLQRDLDQKKCPPSPNLPVSLNKYKLFLPFLVRPYMAWFLLFLLASSSQVPIKPCAGTTCLLVFQPVQLHGLRTCCSLCLGYSFPQPLAWHVSILHSSLRSSLQRPLPWLFYPKYLLLSHYCPHINLFPRHSTLHYLESYYIILYFLVYPLSPPLKHKLQESRGFTCLLLQL